jgi:hypothetical protein
MVKRAVPKPPRVFVLKSCALAADSVRLVEVQPTRVQVVQPGAERVRIRPAARPRAS